MGIFQFVNMSAWYSEIYGQNRWHNLHVTAERYFGNLMLLAIDLTALQLVCAANCPLNCRFHALLNPIVNKLTVQSYFIFKQPQAIVSSVEPNCITTLKQVYLIFPCFGYCRKLRYMPACSEFRAKFHYSNYMYMLAGYVAEIISGESWENLVAKRLLHRLGMRSTGFVDNGENLNSMAVPYVLKGDKLIPIDKELLL